MAIINHEDGTVSVRCDADGCDAETAPYPTLKALFSAVRRPHYWLTYKPKSGPHAGVWRHACTWVHSD